MKPIMIVSALGALLLLPLLGQATEAVIVNGRTLVPLRMVGESFGASVQYDSRTRGISLSLDYQKVNMTVDSPTARVNERAVPLDTAVIVYGGIAYVPIRFVSDTFGFAITWQSISREVIIVHPKTAKRIVIVAHNAPPGLAKKGGTPPGLSNHHGTPPGYAKHHTGSKHKDTPSHGRGHGKKK